jgi:hypothetical protein
MPISAGTMFGTLEIVSEIERQGHNRRFNCRCIGCGTTGMKWLSNLLQGKLTCTVCTPWSEITKTARESVLATRRARSQESDDGRICLTCNEWKPWSKFSNDLRRERGKASNCIECAHWRTVKAAYGITRAEWEWLYSLTEGRCTLCDEDDPVNFAVDHDHSCCGNTRACKKCIRGMLCRNCNMMIGKVEQKPALRQRFVDYLDGTRPFQSFGAGDAVAILKDVDVQAEHVA